jgi:hypothetical protein
LPRLDEISISNRAPVLAGGLLVAGGAALVLVGFVFLAWALNYLERLGYASPNVRYDPGVLQTLTVTFFSISAACFAAAAAVFFLGLRGLVKVLHGSLAERPALALPLDRLPVRIECPGCLRRCEIAGVDVGRSVRCPECHRVFTAQAVADEAVEQSLPGLVSILRLLPLLGDDGACSPRGAGKVGNSFNFIRSKERP